MFMLSDDGISKQKIGVIVVEQIVHLMEFSIDCIFVDLKCSWVHVIQKKKQANKDQNSLIIWYDIWSFKCIMHRLRLYGVHWMVL